MYLLRYENNNWISEFSDHITFGAYGILSNNINDIVFDEDGYVYLATDIGISILETTFSNDTNVNNIALSPNPFKVKVHDRLILSNVSKYSVVKILNLSGKVLKEFDVQEEGKTIFWDGKSKKGKYLSTGIYLISIYDYQTKNTGVTKLAIIN